MKIEEAVKILRKSFDENIVIVACYDFMSYYGFFVSSGKDKKNIYFVGSSLWLVDKNTKKVIYEEDLDDPSFNRRYGVSISYNSGSGQI